MTRRRSYLLCHGTSRPTRPPAFLLGMIGGMYEQPTKRGGPIYLLKSRSRRFWIIAAVLLPVSYVLSYGPACWFLRDRYNELPGWSRTVVWFVYRPIGLLIENGPKPIKDAIVWWGGLGQPRPVFRSPPL